MTYRKYSITTGWLFKAAGADATAEPGLVHFDPVDVDFATFINAQVTYTGAMDAFAVAGTSLIAAMIAISLKRVESPVAAGRCVIASQQTCARKIASTARRGRGGW